MKLSLIQEKAVPILRRAGVRRASLFGSVTRGKSLPNDIDILVELSQQASLLNFINLKNRLEEGLGQKVDLVEYGSIKPALKTSIMAAAVDLM